MENSEIDSDCSRKRFEMGSVEMGKLGFIRKCGSVWKAEMAHGP